jgi:hypothetical protein
MSDAPEVFQRLVARDGNASGAALASQNQVTVYPGGQTFSTIQAAIDSIPNQAGPDHVGVYVGPGTYEEKVTLKPWVAVMGEEADLVTITQVAGDVQSAGVLTAASNSAVSGITVTSVGHAWGDYATALLAVGVENFVSSGVVYKATDAGNAGVNIATAQIDLNASTPSSILLSNCQFLAEASNNQSGCAAINAWYQPTKIQIDFGTLSATGGSQNFGLISETQPVVNLNESKIIGSNWAIYLPENAGHVTATDCTIDGPVSQGVVVKNASGGPAPTVLDARKGEGLRLHQVKK